MRELGQGGLALDDARGTLTALLLRELAKVARFADVQGHVGRKRRRHLAVLREAQRDLPLLDRRDDALGLRHELGLAEPAGRLGRLDEPLRVLGAHVAVDAFLDRFGTELRDRVARGDTLRAALVAEVAARAGPDPVLAVVLLEPL